MKIFEANDEDAIIQLLNYLNHCHDASMKEVSFTKKREFDEDGDLVYPSADLADFIKCDIQVQLLLNSYVGAKTNQVVLLEFKEVESFSFSQDRNFDYSDIYELKLRAVSEKLFELSFYATTEKVKFITIVCHAIKSSEL